jgi:hypothetical protein
MRNMVGIAGRMFSTLAQGNVNIEMISQGASEINISCVIEGRDAVKALNLIHQSCLQINPSDTAPIAPRNAGERFALRHIPDSLYLRSSMAILEMFYL